MIQVFHLTGFAFLLATGQILFKQTASTLSAPLASIEGLTALAFNPWFWLALMLYGAATLLWIMILQTVPLSLAYPFMALGFVLVPLASWLFFKETLTLGYAAGVGFIILGLGLITASAK
ncbi:MAG: transporter [Alphaproteobacteria bacterium]|nr:transporter [Alphaproteobacteria bacterium]